MRGRRLAIVAVLFLQAACGRGEQAAPDASPPEPPEATFDLARPLNAIGNEPFWALKIRPEGLTFSEPARPDLAVPNPGPKLDGDRATWSAPEVKATLRAEVCQDAMSGLAYPFAVEVEAGGRTLKGCGAYADAMPREGG